MALIGQSSPPRRMIECRDGHPIWYEAPTAEAKNAVQQQEYDRQIRALGFSGRMIRWTTTYNCAGHVFAARKGWLMDGLQQPSNAAAGLSEIDPSVMAALNHDGYRQRPNGELPRPGDVVLYKSDANKIEHVAIVINWGDPIYVNSKFGPHGEYTHPIDSVPEAYGRVHSYWTLSRGTEP